MTYLDKYACWFTNVTTENNARRCVNEILGKFGFYALIVFIMDFREIISDIFYFSRRIRFETGGFEGEKR